MNAEREWIQYPRDVKVDTAYGPVFLSCTGGTADHVYVDASGNGRNLTFRGKKYPHLHPPGAP